MVEGARLESVCRGNSTVGSNPTLSANHITTLNVSGPLGVIVYWLFKEEPSSYSFEEFVKDGQTSWTGVKNPLAQKHLRSVKNGDRVFYYHTGNEKAVVGIARAIGNAYLDPSDASGKRHTVDIAPSRKLRRPVTLAEIKADRKFAAFPLVRISRLSVMPVSAKEWAAIEFLSKT